MAYDVYTLTGYVFQVRDSGEFDKRFIFFSKDHGILSVLAVGTARPASKLRGYLTRFCRLDIDVVHGKSGYRLVRARASETGFLVYKRESYQILSRFSELVLLLLPEHAAHTESFTVFEDLANYLENTIVIPDNIDYLYYLYAMRLLSVLGYRSPQPNFETHSLDSVKIEYEKILHENGLFIMI